MLALVALFVACGGVVSPDGWAGPKLVNDTLYVSIDEGKLAALNAEDLKIKWLFPGGDLEKTYDPEAIYGAPVVTEDAVIFGAHDASLYALDPENGALLWEFETGDPIVGAPSLAENGTLYVGSTDGNLYVITIADCANDCEDAVRTFDAGDGIWSSPLVTPDAVYVATVGGRLYALNPGTLETLWEKPFEAASGLLTDPVLASESIILVGGIDEKLYAVDTETGEQIWDPPFKAGNWLWGRPLVNSGTIYVPSLEGNVYALDAGGNQTWDRPFETLSPVRSSPLLVDDVLVVIDKEGNAYGLDPSAGTQKWGPVLLDKTVLSDPLFVNGEVLVVAQGGDLFRIDPENGAQSAVQALR